MKRNRWMLAVAALLCTLPAVNVSAESLKVGVISQSANNWPLFVAEEKGFFQRAGLQVEVVVTGDSGRNIDGLAAGNFEITHQASDHFVRVGLVPGGKLSMEGIRQILELMGESGQLKLPVGPPEKYADPSYGQKAPAGMSK